MNHTSNMTLCLYETTGGEVLDYRGTYFIRE